MHKNQMWELQLEPASVSVVECSEIKIVSLNDNRHLRDLKSDLKKQAL